MRSFTGKENHIGSAFSKILQYTHINTHTHPITFMQELKQTNIRTEEEYKVAPIDRNLI